MPGISNQKAHFGRWPFSIYPFIHCTCVCFLLWLAELRRVDFPPKSRASPRVVKWRAVVEEVRVLGAAIGGGEWNVE